MRKGLPHRAVQSHLFIVCVNSNFHDPALRYSDHSSIVICFELLCQIEFLLKSPPQKYNLAYSFALHLGLAGL